MKAVRQPIRQNAYTTPSCVARCRARSRSTVIPHTGSTRTMSSGAGCAASPSASAGSPASVAGPGMATNGARPRRTCSSSARIESATSSGVSAPRSMPAGARSAATRSSGTALVAEPRADDRRPRRRRDEPDVGDVVAAQGTRSTASSSQTPCVATTTYGLVSGSIDAQPGLADTRSRARGTRPGPRRGRTRTRASRWRRPGWRARAAMGVVPATQSDGRGEVRLHVDLQGPARVAGHHRAPRRRRRGGPPPARPSRGAAGAAGRPASERSASRTTTGWAHAPPTQPSMVPSGWTMPRDPGLAEVGRWTATTVAVANTRRRSRAPATRR